MLFWGHNYKIESWQGSVDWGSYNMECKRCKKKENSLFI